MADALPTDYGEEPLGLYSTICGSNGKMLPRRLGDTEITRRGFVKFDINQSVKIKFDKPGWIWRET